MSGLIDIDWSKSIPGIHRGLYQDVIRYMPELNEIVISFPDQISDFVWDVKVHMLMPRQYPCIPNWHSDFVPRDENNLEMWDCLKPNAPMYLWLSGEPFTEFFDGRKVEAGKWIRFNQLDTHRGTESKAHGWRCIIRAAHRSIISPNPSDKVLRRHVQVYCDAAHFRW